MKSGRVHPGRDDGAHREDESSVPEGFGRPRGSSDVGPGKRTGNDFSDKYRLDDS